MNDIIKALIKNTAENKRNKIRKRLIFLNKFIHSPEIHEYLNKYPAIPKRKLKIKKFMWLYY